MKSFLLAVLSIGAFAAVLLVPAGMQGQPQGKDKAKKGKATPVRAVTMATGRPLNTA